MIRLIFAELMNENETNLFDWRIEHGLTRKRRRKKKKKKKKKIPHAGQGLDEQELKEAL